MDIDRVLTQSGAMEKPFCPDYLSLILENNVIGRKQLREGWRR